jgi:phage repressor protein C with HTH and peptisase S24 domain
MGTWLQDELQRVMAENGLKAKPWSIKAGLSETYVKDVISGKSANPGADGLRKLAQAAGLPGGHFVEQHSPSEGQDPVPNLTLAPMAPPIPTRGEMPKDVPVYGTVSGGEDSGALFDFELNGEIVDYVRRPPRLIGRADVFAAYLRGESVSPWREPGQLIYFERAKAPRVMDYVLVEFKPHDGETVRPALVKRLLGVTPTKIKLRQYNPPKDFEIDRKRVLQIVRAMDWDELMGV